MAGAKDQRDQGAKIAQGQTLGSLNLVLPMRPPLAIWSGAAFRLSGLPGAARPARLSAFCLGGWHTLASARLKNLPGSIAAVAVAAHQTSRPGRENI
jgi:hypothetical protein